jgi:pimeloyl-ACP methyl ester carboxylesterase
VATTRADGVELHYRADGEGEPVAFVGTCGYGAWQWSHLAEAVAGPYEAVVYDHRGTGRSGSPPGPYDVDRLAADLEAVLAAVGAARVHLVGAGLGGAVALRHAREYGRARSLALVGTAASGEAVDRAALTGLFAPPDGDETALRESLAGAFSPAFRDQHGEVIERVCAWRRTDDADRAGFEAQRAAWLDFEAGPLYELDRPAVVFHGVADPVVPAAAGRRLAEGLPQGGFVPVEGRHLVAVEQGPAVADRLLAFLAEHAAGAPGEG